MKPPRFISLLIIVLLASLLAAFYLADINEVEFHPDESQWIATSRVFEAYFTAQFDSPVFDESYWTLTQPPLARYVIGMGRLAGGFRWDDLNVPWKWEFDAAGNAERGALPSEALLWWSRLPMAIAAIISILVAFALVRRSAGYLAGFIWLALAIGSVYLLLHLRRAMGEATLLFCVALVLLVSYRILLLLNSDKPLQIWRALLWLALLGAVAGAAGAAKLNGLSAVIPGLILAIVAAAKLKRPTSQKLLFGFLAVLTVSFSTIFVFVALNPYLWSDPAYRTAKMFNYRVQEIDLQLRLFNENRIDNLSERFRVVPARIFQTYATVGFEGSLLINILFCGAGLTYLVARSLRALLIGVLSPAPMAILLVSLAAAGPSLLTPLDWDRYYLLPVFFATIFIAVGAAMVAGKAYQLLKAALERGASIG